MTDLIGDGLISAYGPKAYSSHSTTLVHAMSSVVSLSNSTEKLIQRIYNIGLNILGYIPGLSLYSGGIRIADGVAGYISSGSSARSHEHIAQIGRGAFEAFVPYGKLINAFLESTSFIAASDVGSTDFIFRAMAK